MCVMCVECEWGGGKGEGDVWRFVMCGAMRRNR